MESNDIPNLMEMVDGDMMVLSDIHLGVVAAAMEAADAASSQVGRFVDRKYERLAMDHPPSSGAAVMFLLDCIHQINQRLRTIGVVAFIDADGQLGFRMPPPPPLGVPAANPGFLPPGTPSPVRMDTGRSA